MVQLLLNQWHEKRSFSSLLRIGIFNITYNMPVNVVMNEHHNKQKSLIDYLNTLNNGINQRSIIVMDCGYCSKEMYNELSKHKLYFICQIKKNNSHRYAKTCCCAYLLISNNKNNIIDVNYTNIKQIRIINYKCSNNEYYIATNLIDKVNYPLDMIKNIYHKRWNVENFFRYLKKNNKYQRMKSKKYDSIKKDIYAQLIMSKFVYLFSNYFSKNLPINKKVNMTTFVYGLYDKFIMNFIYCSRHTIKFSKKFIYEYLYKYNLY